MKSAIVAVVLIVLGFVGFYLGFILREPLISLGSAALFVGIYGPIIVMDCWLPGKRFLPWLCYVVFVVLALNIAWFLLQKVESIIVCAICCLLTTLASIATRQGVNV